MAQTKEERAVGNKEAVKRYNKNNPEKLKAKKRRWYEKNSEREIAKQMARVAKATPEQKERRKESAARSNLKRKCEELGITTDDYWRMHDEQGGKCAICLGVNPSAKRLSLDHCHATNRPRQLLCFNCNTAIGKLQDDPSILRRAAEYVERHRQVRLDIAS